MSFLGSLFGDNPAPKVYQYQNQQGADTGASKAIQSIPGASAATGYNPAQTVQAGQNVAGSVSGLPSYAQQALTAGFDPQNQLYQRMLQQNQEQSMANLARQGTLGTPYGAGITNQSNQDFNLNWLNNMLQRQQMGAQTAEGLLGQYGTGQSTGAQLGQMGGTYAMQIPQLQAQDYLQYLAGGTGAENAATNAYNAQNAQSNAFWGGIGNLAGTALGFLL